MRRTPITGVSALLLCTAAAAQGPPIALGIDSPASQVDFSGSTSLGPIVGNPSSFNLAGSIDVQLAAGLLNPIGELRFSPTGSALVTPDISAEIPNPIPFLPPLATITITGLSLSFQSPQLAVGATGTFSGSAITNAQTGILTVTPFGQSPLTTDLAGLMGDPQPITGTISAAGPTVSLVTPLNISFTFDDMGSGLSATITLSGAIEADSDLPLPSTYCSAEANSTGAPASIGSLGSPSLATGSLELTSNGLPQNSLGFFLFSRDQGFVPGFGGSSGNLCLGGQLLRLSNFVQNSGMPGQVALPVPYGGLPAGLTFQIGESWNFQYWFRDAVGGTPTSNTSDGLTVVFTP